MATQSFISYLPSSQGAQKQTPPKPTLSHHPPFLRPTSRTPRSPWIWSTLPHPLPLFPRPLPGNAPQGQRPGHPAGCGQRAWAPAPAPRGVGARAGAGTGQAGVLGEGSPGRRPWRRRTLRAARRAPLDPGGTGAFPKSKGSATADSNSWKPERGLRLHRRARTPLGAAPASPLPIFGLLLEEPVPHPASPKWSYQ